MKLEKRNSANRFGGQYFYLSSGRRWFSLWVSNRQLIEPAGRAKVARELMRYRRLLRGVSDKPATPSEDESRRLREAKFQLGCL